MIMTPHKQKNQCKRSAGSEDRVETAGRTDTTDHTIFSANVTSSQQNQTMCSVLSLRCERAFSDGLLQISGSSISIVTLKFLFT